MAAAKKKTRSVPRLVSDTSRGYTILLIALVPSVILASVLPRIAPDMTPATIAAVGAFATWALLGFTTGIVTFAVFRRATGEQLADWLRATDPHRRENTWLYYLNGGGASSWAMSGSVIAVTAVLVLSLVEEFRAQPLVIFTGMAVVVGSLFMTIASYAVRYAREHATVGGIVFPATPAPVFSDFFYLAVQVSTSFSPADVVVETTSARRAITTHALVSFAFNTVIVALLVAVLTSSVI